MNTDTMQLPASPFGAENPPINTNPAPVPQNQRRPKSGPGFFAKVGAALDGAVSKSATKAGAASAATRKGAVVTGVATMKVANQALAAASGGLAGGFEKAARKLRIVETGARARQTRAQEALNELLGGPEEPGVLTAEVV